MTSIASLLDGDQAAALTALQAELATRPKPVPAAGGVCSECGQPRPAPGGPAPSGPRVIVPVALFLAPEVDEELPL